MKKIYVALLAGLCAILMAGCGFDGSAVDKALCAETWHMFKTDHQGHTRAYQYTFEKEKVTVEYLDVTALAETEPAYVRARDVRLEEEGTYDYKIGRDNITIKAEDTEKIPYTFTDGALTLADGQYFTLERAAENLMGEWNAVDSFGDNTVTHLLTLNEDGTSVYTNTEVIAGKKTKQKYKGKYQVCNGYVKNHEKKTDADKYYFYTFNGGNMNMIGFQRTEEE